MADAAGDAELIASLFDTRVPAIVMTLLFLLVGIIVSRDTADPSLGVLIATGTVASVVRIGVRHSISRILRDQPMAPDQLHAIERRFAVSYLVFAGLVGLFCARALAVVSVEDRILIGVLMTGYAAGVAAGVTLRPRIAVAAILLALVPSVLVAAATQGLVGATLAIMLVAFVGGGLRSMQVRYHAETTRISLRRTYERLAQQDYLTQIANRRGLEQQHHTRTVVAKGHRVVAHCLDLDGFKDVNDLYGHAAGDALLIAVAARLEALPGDAIAARLGGDEFALVQFDAPSSDAALAGQLEESLSAPYEVDGTMLAVGVSIGTASGPPDMPLSDLLREADLRQRLRKLERRGRPRLSQASPIADAPSPTIPDSPVRALFL